MRAKGNTPEPHALDGCLRYGLFAVLIPLDYQVTGEQPPAKFFGSFQGDNGPRVPMTPNSLYAREKIWRLN